MKCVRKTSSQTIYSSISLITTGVTIIDDYAAHEERAQSLGQQPNLKSKLSPTDHRVNIASIFEPRKVLKQDESMAQAMT